MQLLPDNLKELEYVLRMVIAIILGFAIGTERKMRFKEAGMRTHAIVSAGACLFMLVSKYGFSDVDGKFDTARIAAQVVSGIGFIGAGMIMYRKQAVHGLTTAAGVWITSAIGMASGAGMYILAVSATVIIIIAQCIMHIDCNFFKNKRYAQLKVIFKGSEETCEKVKELFSVENYVGIDAKRHDDGIVFSVIIRTDKAVDDNFIVQTLNANPFISSIVRLEDDAG